MLVVVEDIDAILRSSQSLTTARRAHRQSAARADEVAAFVTSPFPNRQPLWRAPGTFLVKMEIH